MVVVIAQWTNHGCKHNDLKNNHPKLLSLSTLYKLNQCAGFLKFRGGSQPPLKQRQDVLKLHHRRECSCAKGVLFEGGALAASRILALAAGEAGSFPEAGMGHCEVPSSPLGIASVCVRAACL